MKAKTIIFIHGMYMTPLCWEQWMDYFISRGYECLAPAWPGRDKSVETLRELASRPSTWKSNLDAMWSAIIRK